MIQDIVNTLSEAQKLMYLPDNQQSPESLLWFYLVMFVHMLFIRMNVYGKVKKITNLFGSHNHSLIHHSSQQYQITNGRLVNTETEEATFNSLKIFTNHTIKPLF